MGPIPGTTTIFTWIAVIASVSIASLTVTPVEAFQLTSTTTKKLPLSFLHPHRNNRSQKLLLRSPATRPLLSEMVGMTSATSLKGTTGSTNSSEDDPVITTSSSSLSISDVLISKIGSTTSTVVAGTFFIVLCYKRDALMVSFFLGAICNAVFGKILKKVLNIERPEIAAAANGDADDAAMVPKIDVIDSIDRPSDNGMPSSHAMSLGFICTFVALLLPKTTIPLLAYASISLIYRVKVNLHTVDQIAVGAVLGTVDGALWWQLCSSTTRFNLVDWVSASGMMNEYGLLSWYFLAVPALIGAEVVGSVERRLGKYFRSSDETRNSKQE